MSQHLRSSAKLIDKSFPGQRRDTLTLLNSDTDNNDQIKQLALSFSITKGRANLENMGL